MQRPELIRAGRTRARQAPVDRVPADAQRSRGRRYVAAVQLQRTADRLSLLLLECSERRCNDRRVVVRRRSSLRTNVFQEVLWKMPHLDHVLTVEHRQRGPEQRRQLAQVARPAMAGKQRKHLVGGPDPAGIAVELRDNLRDQRIKVRALS